MRKILVVGLGNPGSHYHGTRHNIGQDVVRRWHAHSKTQARAQTHWRTTDKPPSKIASVTLKDVKVTCLLPQTFMNNSGHAVAALAGSRKLFSFFGSKVTRENLLIVHDDLELPFGEVALKDTGSAAGHNGVRSIQQALNTSDFARLRIGIGRPNKPAQSVSEFVLESFQPNEKAELQKKIPQLFEIITTFAIEGYQAAQQQLPSPQGKPTN